MILIFSGTTDGRKISDRLSKNHRVIVSVTTDYGEELLGNHENISIKKGEMTREDIIETIESNCVELIVDATHPYATNIKENIISVSDITKVPVVRYERLKTNITSDFLYDSYEDIVEKLLKTEGNILLTIGSKNLKEFQKLIDQNRVYARVLPVVKSIEKCNELGLSPDRIIALQGPFTKEYNNLIIREKNIRHLVTKESSKVGGLDEKLDAVKESSVCLYVLRRPESLYKLVFSQYDDIVAYVEKVIKNRK